MGILELAAIAVSTGLGLAAVFTACVLPGAGSHLSPGDVLIAIGYAAHLSVPVVLLVVATLAVVFMVMGFQAQRKTWVGLVCASALPVVALAMLFSADPATRARMAPSIVLGSVVLAAIIHVMLARRGWPACPWRLVTLNLAILQAAILGACGSAALTVWTSLTGIGFAAWAVAIAATIWLLRRASRGPGRVAVSLLAAIPASALAFAVVGTPPSALPVPIQATADRPPNVVLVVLDTTRRDHLGSYGDVRGLTPNLDAIAAEGAVYEQAISPGPWTVPSHATIFTGWHPLTHGCSHEHHLWLDDQFLTLAEMLKENGYETLALNSNLYLERCNLLQGFDTSVFLKGPYDDLAVRRLSDLYGAPEDWVDKGSGEAVKFLTRWLHDRRDPAKPLFLFLNLFEAHRPYVAPHDERMTYAPADASALEVARFSTTFEPIPLHIQHTSDPYAEKMVRGLYAALIRYQDRRLADILDALRSAIGMDDTLLIVTADHGENLGEAGRWEHIHAVNDTLIHVPLVIRYPRAFPAGTRVAGLCQTTDIVPTVFDVLGLADPIEGRPGRSLVPARFEPRIETFAQVDPYTLHFPMVLLTRGFDLGLAGFNAQRRVIRTDQMKYIWSSDGRHELFDIQRDPYETLNLAAARPELAEALQQRLTRWWQSQPKYVPPARSNAQEAQPVDEESIRKLRSLGYVGG